MTNIPPNVPHLIPRSEINNVHPIISNFVNGKYVESKGNDVLVNVAPATGKVISYVPNTTKEEVDEAIEVANKAFKESGWAEMSSIERGTVLSKVADLIENKYFDELVKIESEDTGKPEHLCRMVDIDRAVQNFRFLSQRVQQQEQNMHDMGSKVGINYTLRRPIGVVGLIVPWNLPLYLLTFHGAAALACGNSVVCKCSEMTPLTATFLGKILTEAGLPNGVFNLVHGLGKDVGALIVEHPDVRMISFTGGTVTGRKVGETCGRLIKKCCLELGGKNAMIIYDDCDIDKAVSTAKKAAFANQGQVCLCCSRILIQENIYEKFLKRFVAAVKEIKVGDPKEQGIHMGSLISTAHRAKVQYYIELAQEEGGKVEFGGTIPDNLPEHCKDGAFLLPTIVSGLSIESRTATEEIFGPVVTLHTFSNDEEAIAMANRVEYGLCGSIITTNLNRAHQTADKMEAGIIWINCWLLRDLRTPFGGVKNSGIGREGGDHSLETYSETKNVCIAF